ncbi:MAG: DUF1460 domain-containing protein [Gemmatimonadetes bacterium]|nr:MAG: DUF1460 domain-containing protein [Gemmatimonadota bacterium]
MKFLFYMGLCSVLWMISAVPDRPFNQLSDEERQTVLEAVAQLPELDQRIYHIFRLFLNVPYDATGPLGECGDNEDCSQLKDPQTRYGLTAAHWGIGEDCVTLRDKVLALAIATDPHLAAEPQTVGKSILKTAKQVMDRLRYMPGKPISYDTRNHYEIKDFLKHHNGLFVTDITDSLGVETVAIHATIKPRELLGVDLPPQVVGTTYIPRDSIPAIIDRLPPASMIYVIRNLKIGELLPDGTYEKGNVLVSHVGFGFREEGHLYFGHASSTAKKVVQVDFMTYFADQSNILGIKVLRFRMPEHLTF